MPHRIALLLALCLFLPACGDASTATIVANYQFASGNDCAAEGVEEVKQLDFLRDHKCDESQGFLFSKPVTAEELRPLLKDRYFLGQIEDLAEELHDGLRLRRQAHRHQLFERQGCPIGAEHPVQGQAGGGTAPGMGDDVFDRRLRIVVGQERFDDSRHADLVDTAAGGPAMARKIATTR